jgi:hypothetical protein
MKALAIVMSFGYLLNIIIHTRYFLKSVYPRQHKPVSITEDFTIIVVSVVMLVWILKVMR